MPGIVTLMQRILKRVTLNSTWKHLNEIGFVLEKIIFSL
jgi:hypothetical protein